MSGVKMQGVGEVSTACFPRELRGGSMPPKAKLRVGYLGGKTDHCENITRLMASAGMELPVVVDSANWGIYKQPPRGWGWSPASGVWRKSTRARNQLWGTRHAAYAEHVAEVIDRHGLNCILAYWSSALLGDLMAVKRMRPGVKVVLNLLCHPLGLTKRAVAMQNWYFRRSVGCLDGIIVPGETMKGYLEQNILGGRELPTLVWPPCYSRHLYPAARREPEALRPNVLFMGRMDYYRAQPSDDVRGFIDELMDCGVHVHHHSAKGQPGHANRHVFEYLPLREAEVFATGFDASLILYNLEACERRDRFAVTVPDRLLASVTAGVPIAIPAQGYEASLAYLKEYEAVIVFASARELAERLRDRAGMDRLRALAQANSEKYVGEKHVGRLLEFLGSVAGGS